MNCLPLRLIPSFILFVMCFLLFSLVHAATLVWETPDGDPELAEYKIHYGVTSRPSAATHAYDFAYDFIARTGGTGTSYPLDQLSGLQPGARYYLTVTAVDRNGQESPFSNQIPVDIPAQPNTDSTGNTPDATPPGTEDDIAPPPAFTGNLAVLPLEAVSASGAQEPHVAANAFDGDLTTRWSAEGDGQWLQFDLGPEPVSVGQVAIAWYQGDRRTAAFTIDVSLDGTNWTEVYSGNSSGTSPNLEAYDFAAVAARYVRIVGFGNSANLWNSLLEVEID